MDLDAPERVRVLKIVREHLASEVAALQSAFAALGGR